jgi:SAM-dependent methyltransferase
VKGRVLAIDRDTSLVGQIRAGNLDVARLDVSTAELPRESFDLVHARGALGHLPKREGVLDRLVGALAPQGWLLLEEPEDPGAAALDGGLHGEMLTRVMAVAVQAGFDPTWARDLPARLRRRGLADVAAESEVPLIQGGSPTTEFFRLSALAIGELGPSGGVGAHELDRWDRLLEEPDRWFPGYPMVAAWGRHR